MRATLHDLATGEMLARLHEETLQLAITAQLPVRFLNGLKTAPLACHPISIAVAPRHPLAKSKSVTLERLALEPLIALSSKDYPESKEAFERVFAQVRPKPRIVSVIPKFLGAYGVRDSRRGGIICGFFPIRRDRDH